jgi:hypothetical protein
MLVPEMPGRLTTICEDEAMTSISKNWTNLAIGALMTVLAVWAIMAATGMPGTHMAKGTVEVGEIQ